MAGTRYHGTNFVGYTLQKKYKKKEKEKYKTIHFEEQPFECLLFSSATEKSTMGL